MKTLKEIEKLSPEELERLSAGTDIPVPEGLQDRIRENLTAQRLASSRPERRIPAPAPVLAGVAAAAALLIAVLPARGPKDSFDDPYLAYAEVEKAFQTISDKMSTGVDLAREAREAAQKSQTILDKIQNK